MLARWLTHREPRARRHLRPARRRGPRRRARHAAPALPGCAGALRGDRRGERPPAADPAARRRSCASTRRPPTRSARPPGPRASPGRSSTVGCLWSNASRWSAPAARSPAGGSSCARSPPRSGARTRADGPPQPRSPTRVPNLPHAPLSPHPARRRRPAGGRRPRRRPVDRLDARAPGRSTRPARPGASSWTASGCSSSTPAARAPSWRPARRGLDGRQRPERLERGRQLAAVLRGRRRLVPQGLPPARARPSALTWVVRFESVNYRSRVWLNGKPIGTNRGAYLPFELRLPAACSSAAAPTASSSASTAAASATDFPPVGPVASRARPPAAGGTTAASCARSTCARSTTSTSTRSHVQPELPCATCAATVRYKVTRAQLRRARAARHGDRRRSARARSTWAPSRRRQALRDVRPDASRVGQPAAVVAGLAAPLRRSTSARTRAARCCRRTRSATGIRSIKVVDGHLLLNGRR